MSPGEESVESSGLVLLFPAKPSSSFYDLLLQLIISQGRDAALEFAIIAWNLWVARNEVIHKHHSPVISSIINSSLAMIQTILQARSSTPSSCSFNVQGGFPTSVPHADNYGAKVFFDGGLKGDAAGFGVAVRAVIGVLLSGLFGHIGEHFHSVDMVEGLALLHATRWAQVHGLQFLCFFSDCLSLIQRVNNSEEDFSPVGHLVKLIKDSLCFFSSAAVCFVPCSANSTAHFFASFGVINSCGTQEWYPPFPASMAGSVD